MLGHGSTGDAGPVHSELPDLSRQKAQCLCAKCPSSPNGSMVYCILGKSEETPAASGCNCGVCRVKAELGMAFDRFCEKGSEKDQQENDVLVIY